MQSAKLQLKISNYKLLTLNCDALKKRHHEVDSPLVG